MEAARMRKVVSVSLFSNDSVSDPAVERHRVKTSKVLDLNLQNNKIKKCLHQSYEK